MPPAGYSIQSAKPEHLPRLEAVELAAAAMFPPGALPEDEAAQTMPLAELRQGMEENRLWVALDPENAPVGFALLQVRESAALLAELDVHPAHGRKGLGTALVKEVAAAARTRGFAALYLTTFAHLRWNAPLYRGLGFEVLQPDEQSAFIKAILADERECGLTNRVAMRLRLRE